MSNKSKLAAKGVKPEPEFDDSGKMLASQAVRVVKPVCAGLDVHKDLVVATICKFGEKSMIPEFIQKSFNTFNADLVELGRWLKSEDCLQVYMESTGKYSTPVYNVLEKEGLSPHIVNPKYTRAIKGRKDDKKDSKWIAELACYDLLVDSYIPAPEIRELRSLSRRRIKLSQEAADEKRRIQNILTEANIKLDAVFSDTTGASALKVLDLIVIKGDQVTDEEILSVIHKGVKKRHLAPEALNGMMLTGPALDRLSSALDHLEYLVLAQENLINKMADISQKYSVFIELLKTIPGIGDLSAMSIIAETGTDMDQFLDVNHFISWLGLSPASNSSAGKNKSVKIGKGGKYLKPILVQGAWSAVFKAKDPYFASKYHSIAARRGGKRALIAIARKMMISMYYMFRTGEVFHPDDHEKQVDPESTKITVQVDHKPDETEFDTRTRAGLELIKSNFQNLGTDNDQRIEELLKQMEEALAQKASDPNH